jgi:hypothetical protein
MGKTVFTRSLYSSARAAEGVTSDRAVTRRAEQKAKSTGKLEPLVDPAGFGVIRLSLPRVEERSDGKWEMLVGCPMPIETRVDTTGSMGGNVDVAMRVLPDAFESFAKVLEGYDPHVATGIFGDVYADQFALCRPQFEMQADKIVKQLTLMVPEKNGGDGEEDPEFGIFAGAYFCRHYINRIGLKGYDFTVTDAPTHGRVGPNELEKVFGDKVWEKLEENGHQLKKGGTFDLSDIFSSLLDRAHAFVLLVEGQARSYWVSQVGKNRVVNLPDTEYLPHVQAAIIGLTEGTLLLNDVAAFLQKIGNMNESQAKRTAETMVDIPIGAQSQLPNFEKRPMKGDLFDGKPDVWKDENLWPSQRAGESDTDALRESVTDYVAGGEKEEDDWL